MKSHRAAALALLALLVLSGSLGSADAKKKAKRASKKAAKAADGADFVIAGEFFLLLLLLRESRKTLRDQWPFLLRPSFRRLCKLSFACSSRLRSWSMTPHRSAKRE